MTTTETPHHDAGRRSELLIARYTTLTQSNPGFHYHWHMRDWESDAADADSVTSALVERGHRGDNLRRLVSDDQLFQIWRLRLEHPMWWIGTRVRYTTSMLAQIISELTGEPAYGSHSAIGGVGTHWFNQTKQAIQPLSGPARQKLAAALRRELLGRQLCMSQIPVEAIDVSVEFPESEFDSIIDGADLMKAVTAAEGVHGTDWADAFKTMLGDLDPITWGNLAESLVTETPHTHGQPGHMTEVERPDLRVIYGDPSLGHEPRDAYLTITDVARACGLPQPVIAQLVPRTWTDEGWMYTEAQLELAVEIAASRPGPSRHRLTLISRTTDRGTDR